MSTPMQKQYDRLKKKYNDCILLFRLGDFYESFDNDAKILSKILSIVLTRRGKGEKERPMAGIPHHALDNYLPKIVKAGYKVAIAEQLEEPQKGKKVVDRDVVKVITAGTITNEKVLNQGKNNYIACLNLLQKKSYTNYGLSVCDLTTGEFYITEYFFEKEANIPLLLDEIRRINPAELLLSEQTLQQFTSLKNVKLQKIDDNEFNYSDSKQILLRHFKVRNLKGFGIDKYKSGITAAGVLLKYLFETQKTSLTHISKIYYKHISKFMFLDESTIRNLELVSTIRNDGSPSLLDVLDDTKTPMGKRKLYNWIIMPLISKNDIELRNDGVEELYKDTILLNEIRSNLDEIFDIERILGRIGTESINARDLLALKQSLDRSISIAKKISAFKSKILQSTYKTIHQTSKVDRIIKLIDEAITDDPPAVITEGNIIREGYSKELDRITEASKSGKEWLRNLQLDEIKKTGISSLKVKFNKVFGYYIEITKSNLDKVPENYIRKQTLVNAERFITPELKEKEELILNAQEKAIELEYKLFVEIRLKISRYIKLLQSIANSIASLDVLCNFSHLALNENFVKPVIVDNGDRVLDIENGRHYVVEKIDDEDFIPNDAYLNCKDHQIAIITGPNMAGKSTFIRQVALIVLMAQIGSFVPASSMKFKPVDRIFTRVGASDNLAAGESTFLIEMNETANILNNATQNSLIILDEVGRGTSTYDGVAIAWAIAEFIHNNVGAKTLFATHYHELVDLEKYLPKVKNFNVSIKESDGKILFLRKIKKGGTDKSYGVYVAEFAGIPVEVIKKAKEILLSLEQEGMFEVKHVETDALDEKIPRSTQMPLMMSIPENPIIKELKDIDVNKMTPIEALEKLDKIIEELKKNN